MPDGALRIYASGFLVPLSLCVPPPAPTAGSAEHSPMLTLPDELLVKIFALREPYEHQKALMVLAAVCRRWNRLAYDASLWTNISITDVTTVTQLRFQLDDKICCVSIEAAEDKEITSLARDFSGPLELAIASKLDHVAILGTKLRPYVDADYLDDNIFTVHLTSASPTCTRIRSTA